MKGKTVPHPTMTDPTSKPSGEAAPEFVAWAEEHQREERLHEAEIAQISEHHDPDGEKETAHLEQAWARERDHEEHLHDSAIEQMKPHPQD